MKPLNKIPVLEIWDFFEDWILEFGASLELGSCCLVLPTIATV
jgi:hypothetical protein